MGHLQSLNAGSVIMGVFNGSSQESPGAQLHLAFSVLGL